MEYLENEYLKIAVAEHGAELSSIYDKRNNRELLWQADPKFWNRHAPVLFPFVGNVKNDEYIYRGKTYHMSSHGFARDMDFEFLEKTGDAVSFVLRADNETKEKYPFDFELVITHKLVDNIIEVIWDVKNLSATDPMYYSIGGHPAFNCPINPGESRNDYMVKMNRSDLNYSLIIQKTREVDYKNPKNLQLEDDYIHITDELFQKDALIFDDYQIESASLCTPDKKPYITLNCKGFPSFGLWSKPMSDAGYVCLEPWIGRCSNEGFEGELPEKYLIQHLEENAATLHSYTITVH
ncbi:MAG: aldose 1-epimerase family protein [Butyrivibrio sp.]|nr:aldose 1-epimerase family protein [Butyrivibrio sp.]